MSRNTERFRPSLYVKEPVSLGRPSLVKVTPSAKNASAAKANAGAWLGCVKPITCPLLPSVTVTIQPLLQSPCGGLLQVDPLVEGHTRTCAPRRTASLRASANDPVREELT